MSLRIIFILLGIVLILLNSALFFRRKMLVGFGLFWNVFGLVLIVMGAIPACQKPLENMFGQILSPQFILFIFMLLGMLLISWKLSVIAFQQREIAMHISLLNQENEQLVKHRREEKSDYK